MHTRNNVGGYRKFDRSALHCLFIIVGLSTLTSCATVLPGLDRLLFSSSSAKVGPLVNSDEQYPATEDKQASVDPEDEAIASTETILDEPIESEAKHTDLKGATSADQPQHISKQKVGATARMIVPKPKEPARKQTDTATPASGKSESTQTPSANKKNEIALEYGAISGKVLLIGEDKKELTAQGTLITLKPANMIKVARDRPSEVHIIDMEDKTYQPRYSTIQAGDQVVFVNKDDIQHNVFSSSGSNAFDLGTYGAGLKRAVTLEETGIVKIYCNIHAEMATFVAVGDQGLSVKADDQGRYQIKRVLPGRYEATIWNLRGETKRMVEVTANETTRLIDRIDTNAFEIEPHTNKFGGKYSTNSTLFEDEFY